MTLRYYNSHSFSITDLNSKRKERRKEEGEEGGGSRKNSEIQLSNLLQGRSGNTIFLYAEEEETEW